MSTTTPTTTPADSSFETSSGAAPCPKRLNVGSGPDYQDGNGWVNLDVNEKYDPDVVHDLDDPAGWPFDDDEFSLILASHVFEHVDDVGFQMQEAARVLAPTGRLFVKVPLGLQYKTDHTHETEWTWRTPSYFDATDQSQYQYEDVPLELSTRSARIFSYGSPAKTAYLKAKQMVFGSGMWMHGHASMGGELIAVYHHTNES